jgi:hypothetical protein
MNKRASAQEVCLLGTRLTAYEVRGLLDHTMRVVANFEPYLHLPAKVQTIDLDYLTRQIRKGWGISSLTERCLQQIKDVRVTPQKIVLLRPNLINLPFGGPYNSLIHAGRNNNLRPLPLGIIPLLQERLLQGSGWTYHQQILCVTEQIELGGAKLLFNIGTAGISARVFKPEEPISADTIILLSKT